MPFLEICLTPAEPGARECAGAAVAVIDVLRATTSMCTALMNGARSVIPVETVEELKAYAGKGCLLAGERECEKLAFADFGNSPDEFTAERVAGRDIVFTTTNCTRVIRQAASGHVVLLASFLNLTAVCDRLVQENRRTVLLCAGWHDRFCLEDTLLAGAMAERLCRAGFEPLYDAVPAALDLWRQASGDLMAYAGRFSHQARLARIGKAHVIRGCLTSDTTTLVPELRNGAFRTV